MAKPLTTATVAAPGFLGLNTQESSIQLSSGYALIAQNCVIDKYGRVGARRGWTPINESNEDLGENNIEFLFELGNPDGTNQLISGGNNELFVGTSTLEAKTVRNPTNSGDISYSITGNNWQGASLPYGDGNTATPHAYLVQAGHTPLVYHKLGSTPHAHTGDFGFQMLGDEDLSGNIIGSLPPDYTTAEFQPNCVLAAYGRIWMADIVGDRQTVYFSQLLNGSEFNGGDSGSLSLNSVFPNTDQIIGLAAHNGFLIIFGRNNIAVYADPIDVTQLSLADFIPNVGCVSRDSIVNTGTDIVFLSDSGVRSLQRVVQEKSLPFRDLSRNVRDQLIENISSETTTNIKAVYYDRDAFYLLSLPTTKIVYCFDMRAPLENGASRVTIWNGIEPHAFFVNLNKELLIGKAGYIGKYFGYTDNTASYSFRYFTNYFDFDQPATIKVLKKVGFVVVGGSSQPLVVKYGFEYTDNYLAVSKSLSGSGYSEYNVSEFGIATSISETQENNTITLPSDVHYVVNFQTERDETYNTSYPVFLDDDGYYYLEDTETPSRTPVVLYLKHTDFLSEYYGGVVLDRFSVNLGGSGVVLQLGLESEILGNPLSIQKIDIGVKTGKTTI